MNATINKFIAEAIDNRSNHSWIVIDAQFIVRYVNKNYCQWVGKQEQELLGYSILDLFYEGEQPSSSIIHQCPLIETMKSKKELSRVECYVPIFQQGKWCLSNTYLQWDETGRPQYAAACYVAINHYKEVENTLDSMSANVIKSFARAIDARDHYTGRHSEHVADLMADLANGLQLSAEQISLAYWSGLVHDIGKIGVPEHILLKPTRLTEAEFTLIKRHPDIGADLLSEISGLEIIAEAVRYHHERYDGAGYPAGLKGLQIPLLSRMLSLCDSYDAMTEVRCYRQPFTGDQALREIEQVSAMQFDPVLSKVFIKLKFQTNFPQYA